MSTTYTSPTISVEDQSLVEQFDSEYVPGVTILKRAESSSLRSKKVSVYVDGLLTTMDEAALDRLIDLGFYIVVTRRS